MEGNTYKARLENGLAVHMCCVHACMRAHLCVYVSRHVSMYVCTHVLYLFLSQQSARIKLNIHVCMHDACNDTELVVEQCQNTAAQTYTQAGTGCHFSCSSSGVMFNVVTRRAYRRIHTSCHMHAHMHKRVNAYINACTGEY